MTLENRVPPRFSRQRTSTALGSAHIPTLPTVSTSVPGAPGPLAGCIRQSNHCLSEDTARQVERLVGEWMPEISRHGLTSATVVRDLSGTGALLSSSDTDKTKNAAAVAAAATTAFTESSSASPTHPATGSPAGAGGALGKRPSDGDPIETRTFDSPTKKPRLVAPGSLALPPLPQAPNELAAARPDLTSSLFFSRSSKHMPSCPQRLSASEAVAAMMGDPSEARDGVTTLRLPKGQVSIASSASPARSSSTPGSWSSAAAEFLPPGVSQSPDGSSQPSTTQLLQGIGVIEFLEQDERATFIVDLHNPANCSPGPLHIIFANAALRAAHNLSNLLQADTTDLEQSAEFSRFRTWAVSFVRNNESTDVCLPALTFGGVSWTCSTLRRRFRVVSGTISAVSATPISPAPIAQASSILDERARGPTLNREHSTPRERPLSDTDYFGIVERAHSVASSSATHVRAHSEPRIKSEMTVDVDPLSEPRAGLALITNLPTPQIVTTFDWTRIPLDDPNLGAHHRFARSVDWASTSLGPVEEWPADLRIMSNMIMGSPHPAAMYWGPDHVAIYNEAYVGIARQKHPQLMGMKYSVAWKEIWHEIEPIFDAAWNNGDATMKHDDGLFLTRNGFVEETYFNWSIIPLVGGDGSVVALYNPAFENTRRKIAERRMLTLREVGEQTSQARDVKSFWRRVQQGLDWNKSDVPFALIYSVSDDSESEVSSMTSGSLANPPQIVLEGSLGVPADHPSAAASIDLRDSEEGFAPYLRQSMATAGDPIVISTEDGTLPAQLVEGLHRNERGFGDPCRTVVVFPVHPLTAGDSVVGFIVLGVNPRRPYDEDYQLFVHLLSRQLATSMASVVLFEEEIKRGQRAAELAHRDKQALKMELTLRTREAAESENRFTRMAEFGPVGLFIADGHGHINYCNDMWWKISGHTRSMDDLDADTLDAWMQSIRDEDRASVEDVWHRLVEEKTAITHEFRFKGSRQIIDGHSVDTWALMSAYPEREENGDLKSIFGCITDISQQKWAEDVQKQRREEAVELKRQQENFIDITSHEMRNPLSAILQCADEISSGLDRYKMGDPSSYQPGSLNMLIDSCAEAANTISLCASHQKRIVDDILTLSKLDSNLLLVTPVDVQPVVVVQKVLRMFETELKSNDIQGHFLVEQSYRDLAIDWMKLDPSRLRQVLINLMTNAIKFTQGRPTRCITVSLGASKDIAHAGHAGLAYFPPRHPDQDDITDEPDWADGEKINLHLAVTDTGPGLDDDEKKILFQRFSQASHRTHVQYGGSGLGLFICRILTELQGGQIGVESQKGQGSTFAFYIKSRRSENPEPDHSASVPTPRSSPTRVAPAHQQFRYTSEEQAAMRRDSPYNPPPQDNTQQAPSAFFRDLNPAMSLDVLIVEDNLVNQKVLQRQLQLSGNKTYVANHGGEALEELRRSRFWNAAAAAAQTTRPLPRTAPSTTSLDMPMGATATGSPDNNSGKSDNNDNKNISVILMDLEMPVMDGMSCTREIRRLELEGVITHHIPIIAVTAYARPEQIESAKSAGVDDVISKPFRIPELIPKIEELVAKYNTKLPKVVRN